MKTIFQKPNQVREVGHMPPQRYKLIGFSFGHNEPTAANANQKRERSVDNALRLLVRARASELEERSAQVRKLSHEGKTEPNARTPRGG